ncbi:MAG: tRNA preQ1(34) S-adenosylmethionine ribosyltransferase-isomerase QueA [Pseudomonadota bacterium]
MKLNDFDFDLPERLIAVRPVSPRRSARLLVARGATVADQRVTDLPDLLGPDDLLVLNNTKVIPARLFGTRNRDGNVSRIEVTLLAPDTDGNWTALIKPLRKVKDGEAIAFANGLSATLLTRKDGQGVLQFNKTGADFDAALAEAGEMPLPPYIAAKRPADARDKEDYQTAFAKHRGAVAAPTASLHFDDVILEALKAKRVGFAEVTLHVGAGTFLPVKVEDVTKHKMHAEWGRVDAEAAEKINAAKAKGGRVIPVGTTALRLIETAATADGKIAPWVGETDIFIYPGFSFKLTDALMTNFHLPKSTLLMLVSALMGRDVMQNIYAHAVAEEYRFFSYGDSSLLIP